MGTIIRKEFAKGATISQALKVLKKQSGPKLHCKVSRRTPDLAVVNVKGDNGGEGVVEVRRVEGGVIIVFIDAARDGGPMPDDSTLN